MLPRIGPKCDLEKLGIDIIQDLNVGRHLQEHSKFIGAVIAHNMIITNNNNTIIDELYKYLTSSHSGTLATVDLLNNYAYVDVDSDDYTDIYFMFFNIETKKPDHIKILTDKFNIRKKIAKSYIDINSKSSLLIMSPAVLRPKSDGRIIFQSKDPRQYPKIISGYLTKTVDVQTLLKSIMFIEKFVKTKAMKSIGVELKEISIPDCKDYKFPSEAYWTCSVKNLTDTECHSIGTCKMGPKSDPEAIVGNKLIVYGIKKRKSS